MYKSARPRVRCVHQPTSVACARHHVMFGLLNDAAIAAHSAALPIPNGTYLPAYPCEYSRAPPATVGTPEYPLLCEYSRVPRTYLPATVSTPEYPR